MTSGTTGDVALSAQLVCFDQVKSESVLIRKGPAIKLQWFGARRLLVSHVEHLVARPQVLLGSAMAVQAPLHLQSGVVVHERHDVHQPLPGVAADPLADM